MNNFMQVRICLFSIYLITGTNAYLTSGLEVEDAEHFIPVKVTQEGSFLSHNLTSSHAEGLVHYNISIKNEHHLLELKPSLSFIAPFLVVEKRKLNSRIRQKLSSHHDSCHFQGKIRGIQGSFAALSACRGLAGMIKTHTGIYYVEPVFPNENFTGIGHRHRIFKRSLSRPNNSKKRRRRRRKHLKNCGTKEKRRIIRLQRHGTHKFQEKFMSVKKEKKKFKNHNKVSLRRIRSISRAHYVEVLLVADTSMVIFHEEWDLITYLLTVMNMVSSLYMDPSIGNMIHIVVVKIVIIEDPLAEPELNIISDSDKTLKSFCKWQKKLNPVNDSDPHHHDVAVLVTRKDICSTSSSGCNTLGVAQVGSICSREENCNVNEDNGITLAHTIAHEIGHNLGMYHDSERIGCGAKHNVQHIMTPSFQADLIGMTWSRCSRRDVTNFLDKGLGQCLHDQPKEVVAYGHADLPPGAMYDAIYQCKLQFSADATECSPPEEICSRLWCQIGDSCTTKLLPPAPGTSCGKHKWCQNLKCVDIMDPLAPVDGGWGEWGPWSECSRTCGAGVSISERQCDHPKPSGGGNFCLGIRRRYKMCNTEPCQKHAPSFRTTQCAFFNNHTYEGNKYEWLPYFEQNEPCKLYCIDSNNTIIMPLGDYAQDGTPCNIGTNDICIVGICQKVGCDWIVGSNTTEDECGVCEGDNSKCSIFNGTYIKQSNSPGYREIVAIPSGAINIKIFAKNDSDNYISISGISNKQFYLNGKSHISLPGEYVIAGATAVYERAPAEKIWISGPIQEMIVVLVVFIGKTPNPGIYYQYSLLKRELSMEVRYNWSYTEWSQCSATCGAGIQEKTPVCEESVVSSSQYPLDGISRIVDEYYCEPNEKPQAMVRTCNDWMCHTHWWIGPWQSCPVSCIDKDQPMRKRSIMCVDGQDLALPDNFCDRKTKPVEYEPCEPLPVCD